MTAELSSIMPNDESDVKKFIPSFLLKGTKEDRDQVLLWVIGNGIESKGKGEKKGCDSFL